MFQGQIWQIFLATLVSLVPVTLKPLLWGTSQDTKTIRNTFWIELTMTVNFGHITFWVAKLKSAIKSENKIYSIKIHLILSIFKLTQHWVLKQIPMTWMNFQTTPGHQSFWQENICLDEMRKGLLHCSIILISRFGQ